MTRKQLYMYLTMHDEIAFKYNGKKYSITFYSDEEHESILSFASTTKNPPTTTPSMILWRIDGRSVVDILSIEGTSCLPNRLVSFSNRKKESAPEECALHFYEYDERFVDTTESKKKLR